MRVCFGCHVHIDVDRILSNVKTREWIGFSERTLGLRDICAFIRRDFHISSGVPCQSTVLLVTYFSNRTLLDALAPEISTVRI